MPYIRNLTKNSIRLGRGENAIFLEPREKITKGKRDDKGKLIYERSEDFAYISEEAYLEGKFSKSEDVLFEQISKEDFDNLNKEFARRKSNKFPTITIPVVGSDGKIVYREATVESEESRKPIATIPMDPDTLSIYAGAERVTTSRNTELVSSPTEPDTMSVTKESLEKEPEGVRRNKDAPGKSLDELVSNPDDLEHARS